MVGHVTHNGILRSPSAHFSSREDLQNTHPTLTLVSNTPAIEREPPTIRLLPRPLDRHITSTHQSLPDIIEAVVNMLHLRIQQNLLDLLGVVASDGAFEQEQVLPDS